MDIPYFKSQFAYLWLAQKSTDVGCCQLEQKTEASFNFRLPLPRAFLAIDFLTAKNPNKQTDFNCSAITRRK